MRHLKPPLPPPISEELLLALLDSSSSGSSQIIQAALGDDVFLATPGVSRTRVPLDGALVLQILNDIVVADTARSDAGALSCFFQRQVGSWRERLCPVAFDVYLLRGPEQRPRILCYLIDHVRLAHNKPPARLSRLGGVVLEDWGAAPSLGGG
jgi:hypothetical protein